jgi:molecular chaperone DnaK
MIAIDLGSAYSSVAVPEEHTGRGFYTRDNFAGCSLILDHELRWRIPSVVIRNPDGEITVGQPVRSQAGQPADRILFAKRLLGERGNYALQPEEAVRHILAHLKRIAEESLGEEAERAVIAVPASFSFNAVASIRRAAEQAGLKVDRIIQEPVAATLAYSARDARDPLCMMVYDLGGGSFEVGLVEKREGVLNLMAADGERLLGGCDFDRSLALWIAEKLKAQGYDLRLDPDEVPDSAMFARLIACAERAKIRLSSSDRCVIVESAPGSRCVWNSRSCAKSSNR